MTRSLPPATGIVLAGGRSSRFGRDKLAEPVGDRTLLEHAVEAVAAVAADVLLVVPPVGEVPGLARLNPAIRPGIVRDPEPYGGPLMALLAGLERAREPLAVVVGGDMPRLARPVLEALLRSLEAAPDAEAAALVHRGRRQPLPLVVRVGVATPAARRRLDEGDRSLVALLGALRVRVLDETAWRPLDPFAATLLDVDRPGDLPR